MTGFVLALVNVKNSMELQGTIFFAVLIAVTKPLGKATWERRAYFDSYSPPQPGAHGARARGS